MLQIDGLLWTRVIPALLWKLYVHALYCVTPSSLLHHYRMYLPLSGVNVLDLQKYIYVYFYVLCIFWRKKNLKQS